MKPRPSTRLCLTVLSFLCFACHDSTNNHSEAAKKVRAYSVSFQEALGDKPDELKKYIRLHPGFNDSIVFLIDMHILSSKFRFFVYDLKQRRVLVKGLVGHGLGSNNRFREAALFSNEPNSGCTSLGYYRIGKSYSGNYGKSYHLYGLDKENSNAFKRCIVLHSYRTIPDGEVNYPITNSYGCPMVSKNFFKELASIIDKSHKGILLYIYY